jgi:hypothetical protein
MFTATAEGRGVKAINFQCQYDVDDRKYAYTAFNRDGSLCGFENAPVRNFQVGVWVDSVTGGYGELLQFDRWDVSMREPSEMADRRYAFQRKGTKSKPLSVAGKRGKHYKRDEIGSAND